MLYGVCCFLGEADARTRFGSLIPPEVLGTLGLPVNLVAVVWGAYGLYLFAMKLKNGKSGNGHGITVAQLREALSAVAAQIDANATRRELERRDRELQQREQAARDEPRMRGT